MTPHDEDKAIRVIVDPGPKKKQRRRESSGGVAISLNVRENKLSTQGDYSTMPDIRLDSEFLRHPKTKKLKRQTGAEGVLSLLALWTWTATNRPSGDLAGLDDEAIELAAEWEGEPGKLTATLATLHWLDGESGAYRVHAWVEYNPWAARAGNRADVGRMGMLKRHNVEVYEALKAKGVTGISRIQYGELVTGQKTFSEVEAEFEAMASAEQEPRETRADESIGAALDKILDPDSRGDDGLTQAVNALLTFPTTGKKLGKGVATAWVSRKQVQYPKLNLAEAIRKAAQYAITNGVDVKSARGYLNSVLEKVYGTPPER